MILCHGEEADRVINHKEDIDPAIMFENLLSNIKIHSMKVSDSISTLKSNTNNSLDNFKSKFKENWSPDENSVEHNPIAQSPSTPSYTTVSNTAPATLDLKWPILIDNEMHWVPHVPNALYESENNDIVERFTNMHHHNMKRRNDREEIRRRLAMGNDSDDFYGGEKLGRKPSLQARLQSGMNLQICFMNDTTSDTESPSSDSESANNAGAASREEDATTAKRPNMLPVQAAAEKLPPNHVRPSTSLLTLPLKKENSIKMRPMTEAEFFVCQAQLQAEARQALSQAKEMAHMQMEVEKQQMKTSPITEMVRCSLEKVGIAFPEDRRRLSRQILTEMNVAQLQVIVNDLHTQIENLNEGLVKFLINRDDLHMEQDSMLVDIEDLTRYLGAKDKSHDALSLSLLQHNNNINRSQNASRISAGDGL